MIAFALQVDIAMTNAWIPVSPERLHRPRLSNLDDLIVDEQTCSEASSGIHKRFILYLFELDNFKYSFPNLVFLLIWSVIPKRTPPAPSGLKMIFNWSKIVFSNEVSFLSSVTKKCLRGEVEAHYEVRNARKADIRGKFAQNLNMLKRLSSTNKCIET